MKQKIVISIIASLCVVLIAVLIIVSLHANVRTTQDLQGDIDEFGYDCTLVTDKELYEYLCKQYQNDITCKNSGLCAGPDDEIYSLVDLGSSDDLNWVKVFTDEEAGAFFETDIYETMISSVHTYVTTYENRKTLSEEQKHFNILDAKMKYWYTNHSQCYYDSIYDQINVDTKFTYYIQYGPETIAIYGVEVLFSERTVHFERFKPSECEDWMIPLDFNIVLSNDELEDKQIAEREKVPYKFYSNVKKYFTDCFTVDQFGNLEMYSFINISIYEPDKQNLDMYGNDCNLITEGILFDYLNELYSGSDWVQEHGLTGTRVATFCIRDLVDSEDGEARRPICWVRCFTNEEAETFITSELYSEILADASNEKFDQEYVKTLKCKLKWYSENVGA